MLWGPLLRAVRRAVELVDRADVPASLRPFATWKPERLAGDRPRRAVAEALVANPRLRERVGECLDNQSAHADAKADDPIQLLAEHGAAEAIAALAARGRWDALAVVANEATSLLAARDQAAAQAARRRDAEQAAGDRRRLGEELASVREDRDALRRRLDETETRLRVAEQRTLALERDAERVSSELEALRATLQDQRRRALDREARLRRRMEEAEERLRVDDARAARAVEELERLTMELRAALRTPPTEPGAPVDQDRPPSADAGAPAVPRGHRAAIGGRPSRLPPGVSADEPAGVDALLQVPGLEVIVDGYNVTKDRVGRPQASLPEQRQWLLRLSGRVAARHGHRVTVVFDGTDPLHGTPTKPRGVFVVFTLGDETADERIVDLVDLLPPDTPALVVSSDRAVRSESEARGANVTTAAAFVAALGG